MAVQTLQFLAREPELLLAMVFGSAATGTERPDSDIDIAVYPRKPLNHRERQRLADAVALHTGRTVDLIDLTHVEGALLRKILRSGKVVFAKEPGILGFLTGRLLAWQEDFEPQLNALLTRRMARFISPSHGS